MFRLIAAGPVGGDETRSYIVDLDYEYTVEQFIREVLLNNREWGYIGIYHKDHVFGYPACTYNYGNLTSEFPGEYLDRKIKCVTASGGWSRMDYRIVLEEHI